VSACLDKWEVGVASVFPSSGGQVNSLTAIGAYMDQLFDELRSRLITF
jgi:hypothetical protein